MLGTTKYVMLLFQAPEENRPLDGSDGQQPGAEARPLLPELLRTALAPSP